MNVIILAGMPATGKSTLAAKLQKKFGYPILEKDFIKEGLFDTLGFSCYAEARCMSVILNATARVCAIWAMQCRPIILRRTAKIPHLT